MTSEPPAVLRMRASGSPTMFGDIADRRVIFAVEVSARSSAVLPTVKVELIEALLRLAYRSDGQTYFNLVEFGGREIVQWSDRMVLATPQTATVAAQWIRGLTAAADAPASAGGATGILGALLAAMADPTCQAVHLVTSEVHGGEDAGAAAGAAAKLLEALRRRLGGEVRLRPVHCVNCSTLAAQTATLNFLCDLAAGTGGSVASVCVGRGPAGGVESVTRVLTADRPSARLARGSDGGVRNQAVVAWPLVPAAAAAPVATPSLALVPRGPTSVICPGPGATLINRSVLVRRRDDGLFYRGRVTGQVAAQVFLVGIRTAASPVGAEHLQETPLADIVSLDDALTRPIGPGDFVLVPSWSEEVGSGGGGAYRPARVLRGRERRCAASSSKADSAQLTVEVTGPSWELPVRTLDPGIAVWIPRELYCRLEYEAMAATAAEAQPNREPSAMRAESASTEAVACTAATKLEAEDKKDKEAPKPASPTPPDSDDEFEYFGELGDGGDRDWLAGEISENLPPSSKLPPPPPPKPAGAARLHRRPRRRPPLTEEAAEKSRIEAYRRAMEESRLEEISRRRAELQADGVLRDPRLRRNEEAAIEQQLRAEEVALRGRGALHTAAVIEARLHRQARREAEEMRQAEAEAERARLRCRRDQVNSRWGDGELLASPEMLRLQRLRLMAEDGERRLTDAELKVQCAEPDKTIAEWLLCLRLAGGGASLRLPAQPKQPPPQPPSQLTTQERQRLTRRAQATGLF